MPDAFARATEAAMNIGRLERERDIVLRLFERSEGCSQEVKAFVVMFAMELVEAAKTNAAKGDEQ